MTVITFDKLAYVGRLIGAGIPEKDARAHADSLDVALREQVATKADLEQLEHRLTGDFSVKVEAAKTQIVLWVVGAAIAQIGILSALRLLH